MQTVLLTLLTARRALFAIALIAISIFFSLQPQTAPVLQHVTLRDMTSSDVRMALDQGFTTVIVPTGGADQSGAHVRIGTHENAAGEAAVQIARDVGYTLVAPVVSFVPESEAEQPSAHTRAAGTVGVSEPVFDGLLAGVAKSLKAAGFKTICFVGAHGQSQAVQGAVAARLSAAWADEGVRVVNIAGYGEDKGQIKALIATGRTMAGAAPLSGSSTRAEVRLAGAADEIRVRRDVLD